MEGADGEARAETGTTPRAESVASHTVTEAKSGEDLAGFVVQKVFVSSTFRDMHGERNHIARYVAPAVNARLFRHRVRVDFVDLRCSSYVA